jgi:hypothetical protein
MSAWVTATIDNTGETIYLNLRHAAQMERRGPNATYTAIQFVVPGLMVRETPEDLINQIGARFSEPPALVSSAAANADAIALLNGAGPCLNLFSDPATNESEAP